MTAKSPPSGEPKSDDNGCDSQPKRQRTEPPSEDNSGNALLKRLWRTRRISGGLVRLGSEPTRYDLQLFPLINHSLNVRRRAELIGDGDGEGSPLVIEFPDCPGNLDVFTTVGEFCLGLMDEKDISVSNVVKLVAASSFLEIESLTLRALKFLEESAFQSLEGCSGVLATFEDSDLNDVAEGTLFDKCERALLRNINVDYYPEMLTCRMGCSVQSLLSVAKLLPPNVTKRFYHSCRMEKLGLFYHSINPEDNPLAIHLTVPDKFKDHNLASFKTSYYLNRVSIVFKRSTVSIGTVSIGNSKQREWVRWIEELPYALPDGLRRSTLMLHLAKSMHLGNEKNGTDPKLRRSILCWSFLSAVLVELVELRALTELRTSTIENFISATHMDAEIADLEKLVGCGLGEGPHWTKYPDLQLEQHDSVLSTVKKFKFENLLSIVRQFTDLGSKQLHTLIVAKVLDDCLVQQLKSKRFTVQQALLIYQEFPNQSRSSHEQIYHVFEDVLRRKALSPKEVIDLTKLLDYRKLSDKVVEKLMGELQCDCNPRLWERFMKKQRERQIDLKKSKEGMIKLRSVFNVQSADLTKAAEDIQLAERESNDLRRQLEEKQREWQSDREKGKEGLIKLRNVLNVQTADLVKVRQELSARSADLTTATQDTRRAESKLEIVRRDLEEEKEKTTCMICFNRPRDALSLPCGHFLYCSDCLQEHHCRSKTCPTCRSPTTTVLKCLLSV